MKRNRYNDIRTLAVKAISQLNFREIESGDSIPSIFIAYKEYKTIASTTTCLVYLNLYSDGVIAISGEFTTEGNNILTTSNAYIQPTTFVTKDAIDAVVTTFVKDIEKRINSSRMRRLYLERTKDVTPDKAPGSLILRVYGSPVIPESKDMLIEHDNISSWGIIETIRQRGSLVTDFLVELTSPQSISSLKGEIIVSSLHYLVRDTDIELHDIKHR